MNHLRLALRSFWQLDGEGVAFLAHRKLGEVGRSAEEKVDRADARLHVERAAKERGAGDFQFYASERQDVRIARLAGRRLFLEEAEKTRLVLLEDGVGDKEVGRVIEGMPVTITVGAVPNLKIAARLEYISPKGRESNGANQFEIKAALSLPDSVKLRSGYGANAEIVLEKMEKAVCVPEAALEFEGDSTFVYVLTDSVPKQKFQRRQVQTGLSNGIDIYVSSGVKVGEKVRGILKEDK